MKSRCTMPPMMARRMAGLSKGGSRWFGRQKPTEPLGSRMSTFTPRARRSCGTRSIAGSSHQSTSPWRSAAEAVPGSGMVSHSTRSKCTALPPAM